MLGKISKVAAGATVGLVAMAPMAWAGGTGDQPVTHVKGDSVDSGKHDQNWGDKDKHEHHFSGTVCSWNGGDAEAASLISGKALGNIVAQVPIAGNNAGNLANCSDFLNNNLNNNLSGNHIAIASGLL